MCGGDASSAGTLEEEQEGKRAAAAYACEGRRCCLPRCVVPAIPSSSFPDPLLPTILSSSSPGRKLPSGAALLPKPCPSSPLPYPPPSTTIEAAQPGPWRGSHRPGRTVSHRPAEVAVCGAPCWRGVFSFQDMSLAAEDRPPSRYARRASPRTREQPCPVVSARAIDYRCPLLPTLPEVKNKNLPCIIFSRPCVRTRLKGYASSPMSTTGMRLWMLL